MRLFIDHTGEKFGRLKVLEYVGQYKNGEYIVKCVCDCGTEKLARLSHVKNGAIKSCGCLQKEVTVDRNKKYTTAYDIATRVKQILGKENWLQYRELFPLLYEYWEWED